MAFARSTLYGGPGLVNFGSKTLESRDDITMALDEAKHAIDAVMYGTVDYETDDVVVRVNISPLNLWDYISVIFPSFYRVCDVGARLIGADAQAVVWGKNTGDLFTIKSAAISKVPTLNLGAGQELYGPVELVGVVEDGKQLSEADALYSHLSGQPSPGAALDKSTSMRERWEGAWSGVAGFTAFEGQNGFTVEVQPRLRVEQVQGLSRQWTMDGLDVAVRCVPVGPTTANIKAAQAGFGSGWPQGTRIGSSAATCANLVLTSASGKTVTIKKAVMQKSGFVFGRALRAGEVAFTSIASFSGTTQETLLAIA